jgi:hypothetical protein
MKISAVFQFFCIIVLVGCAPGDIKQSVKTPNSESLPLASPTLLITPTQDMIDTPALPSITATTRPAVTDTPALSSKIIGPKNLDQLSILKQWNVEGVSSYDSTNFWFSDSNQFVVRNSDGLQSLKVDDLTPAWFIKSFALDFTINENDQVIFNLEGLNIFDRQGVELQKIHARSLCNVTERAANFIGVQDHYDDYNFGYDKARLLIWDVSKNSCSELIKLNGFLSSLSASEDGRYISYNFVVKTTDVNKFITRIYDLTRRKEKCELAGGFASRFSLPNQFAVYDSSERMVSLVTLDDCVVKTKYNAGNEIVHAFAISPSGELLVGVIDHAIRFWDIQTGEKLLDIKLDRDVLSIIGFSPDGHFLVAAKRASDLADKVMLWGILEK